MIAKNAYVLGLRVCEDTPRGTKRFHRPIEGRTHTVL